MIRRLFLRALIKVLYWVGKESLRGGDDALADKADALAREVANDLDKHS